MQIGCLQRIADATEKMASNYTKMQNDLKWEQDKVNRRDDEIKQLQKSNAALRGHIKRLKRKYTPLVDR